MDSTWEIICICILEYNSYGFHPEEYRSSTEESRSTWDTSCNDEHPCIPLFFQSAMGIS